MKRWKSRRAAVAVLVALAAVSCGGRASLSGGDPDGADAGPENGADAGSQGLLEGGDSNASSANDGNVGGQSTAEAVASAQANQAASDSGTGGTGGTAGTGGNDAVGGSAGVAGFSGIGGGSAVAVVTGGSGVAGGPMEWGRIPIPEECVTTSMTYYEDRCTLAVNCAGLPVVSGCVEAEDDYECSCHVLGSEFSQRVNRAAVSDACAYSIAACLHDAPFKAGTCTNSYEFHSSSACTVQAQCTSAISLPAVEVSEVHARAVSCQAEASGWTCMCNAPYAGRWFEVPLQSVPEEPCVQARDWCAGDAVQRSGIRECSLTGTVIGPSSAYCSAQVACREPVDLAGSPATMVELLPLECSLGADGLFKCECPAVGRFDVSAADGGAACDQAAEMCAVEPVSCLWGGWDC